MWLVTNSGRGRGKLKVIPAKAHRSLMNFIIYLFDGKPGGLLPAAAQELSLPELKIGIYLRNHREHFLPDAAFLALGIEFIVYNPGRRHVVSG